MVSWCRMKVWILIHHFTVFILGVFSSKEEAEKRLLMYEDCDDCRRDLYKIEEFELDTINPTYIEGESADTPEEIMEYHKKMHEH